MVEMMTDTAMVMVNCRKSCPVMPDRKRDMMVLNPGAAGIYGFHLVRTALRFHIDSGELHDMEVFELDKVNGKPVSGM